MRKPQSDPDQLAMSDVLCDFCAHEWTLERPMVEGHRGSCICGPCLEAAYRALVIGAEGEHTPDEKCLLCLENRTEPMWCNPANPQAKACVRCVRQSAAVLQKDPDSHWTRPER